MFCSQCGLQNGTNDKFCGQCGNVLPNACGGAQSPQVATSKSSREGWSAYFRSKRKTIPIILSSSIVLILMGAYAAIVALKPASIVVHEVVVHHGLSFDATHFASYNVGSTPVVLDVVTTIKSGTYPVTEKGDADYTTTFSGDCNASGIVAITWGSAKNCTMTNTEIPTKLTVHEIVVNHGLAFNADHFAPYAVDGGTVPLETVMTVNSGAHKVTETQDSNYTQTFSGACDAS